MFPPLYSTLSLKNTGITHPVLIDVVSGVITPVSWKQGTTDTLEALPVKDSIMAVADESYFDWPVLPEAPSSLNLSVTGNTAKLEWQIHGGSPTGVVVERGIEKANGAKEKSGAESLNYQPPQTSTATRASKRVIALLTGCTQSMGMESLLIRTSPAEFFQPSHDR